MNEAQFTRISKALADPRRLEILKAISGCDETGCGSIAEQFPIGQSTVSHHLKLLGEAGLVTVRREGQHGYFSTNDDVLKEYITQLSTMILRNH